MTSLSLSLRCIGVPVLLPCSVQCTSVVPLQWGTSVLPLHWGIPVLPLQWGTSVLPLQWGISVLPLQWGISVLPLQWGVICVQIEVPFFSFSWCGCDSISLRCTDAKQY